MLTAESPARGRAPGQAAHTGTGTQVQVTAVGHETVPRATGQCVCVRGSGGAWGGAVQPCDEDGRDAGGAEQASHLSRHSGLEVVALPARLEDGPPEGRGVEHQEEGRDPHERIHLD